jgi:hypothetical protein
MRIQASSAGERRGCRQLDVRACRLGMGAIRRQAIAGGHIDDGGVQGRSVGTSAGSAIGGAQTAAAWLARPRWVDGSISQAAMSDRETVHSEQVEPAVPDIVNMAKDLV